MKIIACADNKLGYTFQENRPSSDRVINEFVKELAERYVVRAPLCCVSLFGRDSKVKFSDSLFSISRDNDYCFMDTLDPWIYEERINTVILFRWNRDYPASKRLESKPDMWKLTFTKNITGFSHDKITMEVYERV